MVSLGETVEPALIEELWSQFQGLSLNDGQKGTMRGIVRRNLHDLKTGLNRAIKAFESGETGPEDGSFKAWLADRNEAYERWRSRLP